MEPSSWQLMLDRITKDMRIDEELLTFKRIQSNTDRVKFCSQNKMVNSHLSEWLRNNAAFSSNQKDSKLALQCKTKGNKAYVKKDNDNALNLYCEALLYCPEDEVSLLYGNRSAVLFNKCLWKECIYDIDVALINGFPDTKSWKLYKRKGEALRKLNRISECKDCFAKVLNLIEDVENLYKEKEEVNDLLRVVSNDSPDINKHCVTNGENDAILNEAECLPLCGFNKYVTSASQSITLSRNDTEGRHFVANKDIECGSILIAEKPYAAVLLPDWYKSHCQHCFVKVDFLFPCKQCTNVCYCSLKCQTDSWNSYHYFECGKLGVMEKIGVSHLAMRVIVVSDMDTLQHFFDESIVKSHDVKGCNENGVYENSYESLYHLMTHEEDLQAEDLLQYTVAGLLLLNILIQNDFFTIDVTDDVRFQIGGLMLRHMLQIVCNAHAITSVESTSNISSNIVEQDQVRIATAIYPTSSILNHSCDPTILNTFDKDKLIVKAIKQMNKGEHVYTCYGPHYRRMDFEERQNVLKGQYFFQCKCDHCSRSSKAMAEFDCYRCPQCYHGFHAEDKACSYCGTEVDSVINEYKEKSLKATGVFLAGTDLLGRMQNETITNTALKKLLFSLKIQEEIYYKYHSSLAKTHDAVAKCYAILKNYGESVTYLEKSIALVEAYYGEESAETMNEELKLCDICMELMQQYIDQKNFDEIKKFKNIALRVVDKCIKLVKLNKEPDSSELQDLNCKHEALVKLAYLNYN